MLQLLGMVSPILLHFALETRTLLLCRFLVVLGAMRNMTWDFLRKVGSTLGMGKIEESESTTFGTSQHDAWWLLQLWHLAL